MAIEKLIKLTPKGSYQVGRCLWCHQESFAFSPPEKRFYCFGCGRGGKAQDFDKYLSEWQKLSDQEKEDMRQDILKKRKEGLEQFIKKNGIEKIWPNSTKLDPIKAN